jgi:hypothetical protein
MRDSERPSTWVITRENSFHRNEILRCPVTLLHWQLLFFSCGFAARCAEGLGPSGDTAIILNGGYAPENWGIAPVSELSHIPEGRRPSAHLAAKPLTELNR